MKQLVVCALCILCLGCSANQPAAKTAQQAVPAPAAAVWDTQTPPGEPLAGERGVAVEASVVVQKVDLAKRTITVKKVDGSSITLKAGPEIQRLNEIKAGDVVTARILSAIAYEVRQPTKEELAAPDKAAVVAGRNEKTLPPAAGAVEAIRRIVTITAVDRQAGTATFKTDDGEKTVVQVKRPENFARIKVGDKAVIEYIEAAALSIEPGKK